MVFFRVAFGLIMLWEVVRYFQRGWIASNFIEPSYQFKYPFFEWVQPLPGVGMYILFALMGVFAACIAVGFFYRISASAFAVLFIYMFTIDAARYLNHFYLVALLAILMIFIPAHRSFSVDAWRNPSLRSETIPAWALYLIRYQIFVVYFFGGVHKFNPDWLHGEPMRSMLYNAAFQFPAVGESFFSEPVVYVFVLGGLLLDLFVVPAMLWKPTRIPAFLAALSFHLTNSVVYTIGIFPWFMICATAMYFPPSWPRRILRKPAIEVGDAPEAPHSGRQKWVVMATVLFMVVQFSIPWRAYAPGGHLLSQQDTMWFSWNMMLVQQSVDVKFRMVDNSTGEEWTVNPADDLKPLQRLVALPKPGHIHELALHYADRARAEGHEDVSVYADVMASVNTRPVQRIVDPTVDLAATPQTLGAKKWVLPLETKNPPDPEERRRFTHARWKYMEEQGYLPVDLDNPDPAMQDDLRNWEIEYFRAMGVTIPPPPEAVEE